jgi:hypothetical protein
MDIDGWMAGCSNGWLVACKCGSRRETAGWEGGLEDRLLGADEKAGIGHWPLAIGMTRIDKRRFAVFRRQFLFLSLRAFCYSRL